MAAVAFFACQKEKKQMTTVNEKAITTEAVIAPEVPGQTNGKQGWYPVGTEAVASDDRIGLKIPAGWSYMGYDTYGAFFQIHQPEETTITCVCNSKGACKPFYATGPWGGTGGCTGTCGNCTMTQSLIAKGHTVIVGENGGGFYQPEVPNRLLKDGEQAPAVFDALAASPEFAEKLQALYQAAFGAAPIVKPIHNADGSAEAPEGYCLVGASIMGRGLIVILPADYVTRELGQPYSAKASCECTNGTGGCALNDKRIMGMGSMWCDGTCNGCKLHTGSDKPKFTYNVSLYSAKY